MKEVWKFPLEVTDLQKIRMPKNSILLTVQAQREVPCLWALVETDKESEERFIRITGEKTGKEGEERFIRIAGTGHPVLEKISRYIGTFQLAKGSFIGHVFEVEGKNI